MAGYQLHLNLLTVRGDFPSFTVFRRERQPNEAADPASGLYAYALPRRADKPGMSRKLLNL
jgi:hypothetical protein